MPDSLEALANHAWALPATMLLRTAAARALGFRSEFAYAEDTDFLWRFNLAGHRLVKNPDVLSVYCRHDGGGDAPQKIDNVDSFDFDHYRMFKKYYEAAGRPRNMRTTIHRRLAEHLIRRGRWRAARKHLWTWWKAKPDSSKALRGLLLSLVKRR